MAGELIPTPEDKDVNRQGILFILGKFQSECF